MRCYAISPRFVWNIVRESRCDFPIAKYRFVFDFIAKNAALSIMERPLFIFWRLIISEMNFGGQQLLWRSEADSTLKTWTKISRHQMCIRLWRGFALACNVSLLYNLPLFSACFFFSLSLTRLKGKMCKTTCDARCMLDDCLHTEKPKEKNWEPEADVSC